MPIDVLVSWQEMEQLKQDMDALQRAVKQSFPDKDPDQQSEAWIRLALWKAGRGWSPMECLLAERVGVELPSLKSVALGEEVAHVPQLMPKLRETSKSQAIATTMQDAADSMDNFKSAAESLSERLGDFGLSVNDVKGLMDRLSNGSHDRPPGGPTGWTRR